MKERLSKRLNRLIQMKQAADYSMSIPKQAEEMGIPYQTLKKYVDGKSECPAYNLELISKYYEVTVDYLLGLTDISTTNPNIRAIGDYTGLSEEAIMTLHKWKSSPDMRSHWSKDFISEFITYCESEKLLTFINDMWADRSFEAKLGEMTSEERNDYAASLWYASKLFSEMVEVIILDITNRKEGK